MGEGASQEKATKRDLEGKSAAPGSSARWDCEALLWSAPRGSVITCNDNLVPWIEDPWPHAPFLQSRDTKKTRPAAPESSCLLPIFRLPQSSSILNLTLTHI